MGKIYPFRLPFCRSAICFFKQVIVIGISLNFSGSYQMLSTVLACFPLPPMVVCLCTCSCQYFPISHVTISSSLHIPLIVVFLTLCFFSYCSSIFISVRLSKCLFFVYLSPFVLYISALLSMLCHIMVLTKLTAAVGLLAS